MIIFVKGFSKDWLSLINWDTTGEKLKEKECDEGILYKLSFALFVAVFIL